MTGATPATRGLDEAAAKKAEPIRPRWPTFKELTDEHDRRPGVTECRLVMEQETKK
jgi:hypothetical protein